jgi:hypothetical protein
MAGRYAMNFVSAGRFRCTGCVRHRLPPRSWNPAISKTVPRRQQDWVLKWASPSSRRLWGGDTLCCSPPALLETETIHRSCVRVEGNEGETTRDSAGVLTRAAGCASAHGTRHSCRTPPAIASRSSTLSFLSLSLSLSHPRILATRRLASGRCRFWRACSTSTPPSCSTATSKAATSCSTYRPPALLPHTA